MNDATAVGAIFIAIMVLLGMLVISWAVPIRLWIEALASGVHVGLGSLVGMRLRKVSPPAIVRPLIAATKAGLNLDVDEFEAHYLAGGDVARVANALISADKANIDASSQPPRPTLFNVSVMRRLRCSPLSVSNGQPSSAGRLGAISGWRSWRAGLDFLD